MSDIPQDIKTAMATPEYLSGSPSAVAAVSAMFARSFPGVESDGLDHGAAERHDVGHDRADVTPRRQVRVRQTPPMLPGEAVHEYQERTGHLPDPHEAAARDRAAREAAYRAAGIEEEEAGHEEKQAADENMWAPPPGAYAIDVPESVLVNPAIPEDYAREAARDYGAAAAAARIPQDLATAAFEVAVDGLQPPEHGAESYDEEAGLHELQRALGPRTDAVVDAVRAFTKAHPKIAEVLDGPAQLGNNPQVLMTLAVVAMAPKLGFTLDAAGAKKYIDEVQGSGGRHPYFECDPLAVKAMSLAQALVARGGRK